MRPARSGKTNPFQVLIRTHKGYVLALSGSILLLTTAVATFVLVLRTAFLMVSEQRTLGSIMTGSMFPTVLQIMWFSMVVGSALRIVAIITIYGFRARWFWRCLVAASVMWLVSPPLHTIIGIIALITLIATKQAFLPGREPDASGSLRRSGKIENSSGFDIQSIWLRRLTPAPR